MKCRFGRHIAVSILAGFMLLGASGCSSQATHHSGQIGRYYGDDVYFSVPVIAEASDPSQEDKFWEVRQGIGGADVVVLGPFITKDGAESFRENMSLSSCRLDSKLSADQFRRQQLEAMRAEYPQATGFAEGDDRTGCWATFDMPEEKQLLACKAWFFVDAERSVGYTLVGTVLKSSKLDDYRRDFDDIAVTFCIGKPVSSFVAMSDALAKACAFLSANPVNSAVPENSAGVENNSGIVNNADTEINTSAVNSAGSADGAAANDNAGVQAEANKPEQQSR